MPLFLYNFESKELHGIFKAASDGEWELDAYGELLRSAAVIWLGLSRQLVTSCSL
jgi:hypothetical protein